MAAAAGSASPLPPPGPGAEGRRTSPPRTPARCPRGSGGARHLLRPSRLGGAGAEPARGSPGPAGSGSGPAAEPPAAPPAPAASPCFLGDFYFKLISLYTYASGNPCQYYAPSLFFYLQSKKVFINREKNEESPGEQSQGCVCVCVAGGAGEGAGGGRSGAGGPRWGCGQGDRPEGLRRFWGELQGESFFVQREERLELRSPLKGTLVLRQRAARSPGKNQLERARSLARHVWGGSQREPQELGYIFMPFRKPWVPAMYF